MKTQQTSLIKASFLSILFGAILSACTVGPNYRVPELTLPASFKESELGTWKYAKPADQLPKGNWWEIFGDETLNRFQAELVAQNFSLQAAVARVENARAQVDGVYANLFPQVNVKDGVNRSGVKDKSASTNYSVNLQASWELDLWGSVKRAKESANAQLFANDATLSNTRLSLQAELAQNYFKLRSTDQELAILQKNYQLNESLLKRTQARYQAGVVAKTDVLQSRTQLNSLESQRQTLLATRAQLSHAIAILLGKMPADFDLPANDQKFVLPEMPLLLPSELLERRPDIAIAERNVASANAKIGIAQAAFYPSLSLSANVGENTTKFRNLFNLTDLAWGLGSSLTQVIFDGGKLKANLRASQASYRESVANYKQTVLQAFAEVENQLALIHYLNLSQAAQEKAVADSLAQMRAVEAQYAAGTVSYLNVLTAQTTLLSQERSLLDLQQQAMLARVILVRGLGGGWKR